MQKVIPKLQGRAPQSREKGINIMEKIKGLWLGFAEKHPGASKWIREGGLFVIVSNLITVLKYFMLLFLPLAFAGLPKVDFGFPGALMVFDRETGDYLVTLGMKKDSHLGGVAFDGENLWVCHSNSNTLERISYEYIRLIAEDAPGYCIDASAISDEYYLRNTPSCITCYGGRIWVATYNKMFRSKMYAYTYDTQLDKLVALSNYNIPCKVQGIAFDSQGAVYLSTSLGRSNSSYLKVYSSLIALNQSPSTPSVKVEMPPCSEEIAIVDNNLYVLFESASSKYFEGTDGKGTSVAPIDKVLKVNVATIW